MPSSFHQILVKYFEFMVLLLLLSCYDCSSLETCFSRFSNARLMVGLDDLVGLFLNDSDSTSCESLSSPIKIVLQERISSHSIT